MLQGRKKSQRVEEQRKRQRLLQEKQKTEKKKQKFVIQLNIFFLSQPLCLIFEIIKEIHHYCKLKWKKIRSGLEIEIKSPIFLR